ncbi:MAG: gliding motility protein GldL [Chitinophagaceae bacterium]|nr:gliding motility protein GldL [Chitinophagaceae bacterium]MBK7121581.1 gliding motility protein GldL [Chitinophagaceae bacterium]MBK7557380.1 gliding motility protein GldL [Chitinophagaceae bacterium]MBK9532796.1 gliding motility protein GldL [Chitinophagaceae bacterium]HQW91463.1 gliding motility protein GldL [Ferruginibacter sp.]
MPHNKRTFLTLIDVLVSAGAAVIIFAAWAKLTHQPFADMMLTIGMWTETAIFLVYAGIEWVKPKHHPEDEQTDVVENPSLDSMDKMLQQADITPTNLKKLGEGFQKLQSTVGNMHEIGDVVKSTGDFNNKTKEATTALGNMTTAFASSAATMGSFSNAADSAKGFHEQVQVLTKNLGSLNTIYELELKESNNHLKSLNTFYGKLAEASTTMMGTVEDAEKAKVQIGALANNLGKLNAVYGNMLSAMQTGR